LCDSPFTFKKSLRLKEKLGEIDLEIIEKIKDTWLVSFCWN